jgi:hypothetical protein
MPPSPRSAAALAIAAALALAATASAQDPPAVARDPPAAIVVPPDAPALTDDPPAPAPDPLGAPPPTTGAGVVDGARSSGDPLAANGLGGALCRSDRLAGGLSPGARANCQTAGVSAAPAPVTHYGFDIHIDTGTLGVSGRTFAAAVQALVLTPAWTLLLWLVHAVLALLEWSYAIDLLDPATVGTLADALRAARELFTEPWLPLALAVAAVAVLYHGLVRRALADSAGQAAALVTMTVLGLAVISDPAGTVGEANALVQRASLGTVAAVGGQDPARADASFADALRGMFATTVQGPWCYLEFGDVEWCRDPGRRDARLASAARGLTDAAARGCGRPGCPDAGDRARADALVGRAASNGDLFLAFPANGDERNAINDADSLFRALCGADRDDDCAGPTAAQARWRTETGTWPRAGGLALITVGVTGMIALLAFLALRLLGAAILTVLCLLLAPVAVLAPALGEGGRGAFRAWGLRLLGALVSKLLYSAFLGVVLLTLRVLQGMGALGWWTQWLLIAAFWWIVFAHRHRVLEYATLSHAHAGARTMSTTARIITGHRLAGVAADASTPGRWAAGRTGRTTRRAAVEGRRRLREQREDTRRRRGDEHADAARQFRRGQTEQLAAHATLARAHDRQRAPHADAAIERLRDRRARLDQEIRAARAVGDFRTVARLRARDQRLADTLADVDRERTAHHAWLDHQATLRRGVPPGPRADAAAYRDYPRLAALAGVGQTQYRELAPGPQRRLRLEVDRALRARAEAERTLAAPALRAPGRDVDNPPPRAPRRETPRRADAARPRLSARERQFRSIADDGRRAGQGPPRRDRDLDE